MSHEHGKSDFIPSPFRTVTQYENAFIKAGNESMAAAMSEILRYVAKMTNDAIREAVSDENIGAKEKDSHVEKARQVGDIDPTGKFVWKEYAPGKFGWRVANKKTAKGNERKATEKAPKRTERPKVWEMDPDIDKLKTSSECQKHLEDLGYISYSSDIGKADLLTAKLVTSALKRLHDLIPYERIVITMAKLKGAIMDASDGKTVRMNTDYFTSFDPARYWKRTNTSYVKGNRESLDRLEREMKSLLSKYPNYDMTKLNETKKKLEERLDKFPRWTYGDEKTLAADIVLHEMGHILNAQCSGGCSHWKNPKYGMTHSKEEIELHKKLNNERDSVYKKYCGEKKAISEYSVTKPAEFFAECFVAWLHDDKELPSYVKKFYDKYFKMTTPRR